MCAIFALIVFIVAAIVTGSPITKDAARHLTTATITTTSTHTVAVLTVIPTMVEPILPFPFNNCPPEMVCVDEDKKVPIPTRPLPPRAVRSSPTPFGPNVIVSTMTVPTSYKTTVGVVLVTQTVNPTITVTHLIMSEGEADTHSGDLPGILGTQSKRDNLAPVTDSCLLTILTGTNAKTNTPPTPTSVTVTDTVITKVEDMGFGSLPVINGLAQRGEPVPEKDMMDEDLTPRPIISLPPSPNDSPGKPAYGASAPHSGASHTGPIWEVPPYYGAPGPALVSNLHLPVVTIRPLPMITITRTEPAKEHSVNPLSHTVVIDWASIPDVTWTKPGMEPSISLPSPTIISDWVTIPHHTRSVTWTERPTAESLSFPSLTIISDWVTIPHITRSESPTSTHR